MLKIAIAGPKNSGKSALCAYLSRRLKEPYAEDFSEQYLKKRGPILTFDDMEQIARGQNMLIDYLKPKNYFISEIEMLTLKIWSETEFKKCSAYITTEWEKQAYNLYLVCWPKSKYQEYYNAEEVVQKIIRELHVRNLNYVILKGTLSNRKKKVNEAIKRFDID